jgi:uncharacterized damage-inducible protein DinB
MNDSHPNSNPRPLLVHVLALLLLFLVSTTAPSLAADAEASLSLGERAELIALLQTSQAETLQLLSDVDRDQWHIRPAEDRWSIGEIVEHLVRAEAAIRANVEALTELEPDPNWQSRQFPTLEQLVAVGSDRSQKFTAPEPIQPRGEMGYDEALQQLLAARIRSISYVLETTAPLRAVASPAPIGQELDGHGWLALLGAHNLRHNKQIAEVKAALSF